MDAPLEVLRRSRALWNRKALDLASDEVLAQLLDRGSGEDQRALYALLRADTAEAGELRRRVLRVLLRVPTGFPFFWLAALQSSGIPIDWSVLPAVDPGEARL